MQEFLLTIEYTTADLCHIVKKCLDERSLIFKKYNFKVVNFNFCFFNVQLFCEFSNIFIVSISKIILEFSNNNLGISNINLGVSNILKKIPKKIALI